jgi:hypothetical protein
MGSWDSEFIQQLAKLDGQGVGGLTRAIGASRLMNGETQISLATILTDGLVRHDQWPSGTTR